VNNNSGLNEIREIDETKYLKFNEMKETNLGNTITIFNIDFSLEFTHLERMVWDIQIISASTALALIKASLKFKRLLKLWISIRQNSILAIELFFITTL
jgi:hypothetical protein